MSVKVSSQNRRGNSKHRTREKKVQSLQNLAVTCWQEVVPEYSNPSVFKNLGSDEIQARWVNVRDYVEKIRDQSPNFVCS